MALNAQVHLLLIGETGYDLRRAVRWHDLSPNSGAATQVQVYFEGMDIPVVITKTTWETAKNASIAGGG